jgi:iron complex transport system substrate-binding protein
MRAYIDQIGKVHTFETTPARIVCLVPSLTELLCDLDLESKLVGVTKFCVHPSHIRSAKTVVGGTKQVHAEKIRDLKPDIIICNKEENTLEMVNELSRIAPVWVTDIRTVDDCIRTIEDFGQLFNRRTEASKWRDKIKFEQQQFATFVATAPLRKVAYFIWKDPYMVAGSDTFIDELLQANGFTNIYSGGKRYPEIDLNMLRPLDPDLILLSSEPYPFKDEHAFEIGRHTHHAKTIFVDGEMFSWYGTRLVKSFRYFRLLHQKLA